MKKQISINCLVSILMMMIICFNAQAQSWKLTGNSGTNPSSNFIGTTDNEPLVLRVNNIQSAKIDNTNQTVFLGYKAGLNNSGLTQNTFVGYETGISNTYGGLNSFFGVRAGYANQSGSYNSLFGYEAGTSNTGDYNSFFGSKAGLSNSTATENSFYGESSGYYTTSGSRNSFFGESAGFFNSTGQNNSFFGVGAGWNSNGNNNVGIGYNALAALTTQSNNTAVGNSTADVNSMTNGTLLGYNAGVNASGYTNCTALGYNARATKSNYVAVGNTSVTSIQGQVNFSTFSDKRVKKDIQLNVPGLSFIKLLQPVTYHYDIDKEQEIMGTSDKSDCPDKYNIEKITFSGFLAQDVEEAAEKVGYDFSGVDKPDNENTLYGLRYGDFVVPLVKSVQELSTENDSLKNDNAALHQQINDLISRMSAVEQSLSQGNSSYSSSPAGKASIAGSDVPRLEQNVPNPFSQSTTIQFYIPASASDAMIVINDPSGKAIQQFGHLSVGNGTITIAAGTFPSGTYQYSLIINGNVIASKQMVITK